MGGKFTDHVDGEGRVDFIITISWGGGGSWVSLGGGGGGGGEVELFGGGGGGGGGSFPCTPPLR